MFHSFRDAVLAAVVLMASAGAQAAVNFVSLSTAAPPATIAHYTMLPFDEIAQAAIADLTWLSTIPGNPIPGALTASTALEKNTVGATWVSSWSSHGYTGPVWFSDYQSSPTLTLPANTGAFYFYLEPNNIGGPYNFEIVTNNGTTSGAIPISGTDPAAGYAFYTTAGETIASITITADPAANGFAIGEFGIAALPKASAAAIPALSPCGMVALIVLLGLAAFAFNARSGNRRAPR